MTRKPRLRGLYVIMQLSTSRTYVGSSGNVLGRLRSHRLALERCHHTNRLLQAAWDKAGEGDFVFMPTEPLLPRHDIIIAEQRWMDCFPADLLFNILPAGHTPINTIGANRGRRWPPSARAAMARGHILFWDGDQGDARGRASGKLTWALVREIRRRRFNGEPSASLARAFAVRDITIRAIIQNRNWPVSSDPDITFRKVEWFGKPPSTRGSSYQNTCIARRLACSNQALRFLDSEPT